MFLHISVGSHFLSRDVFQSVFPGVRFCQYRSTSAAVAQNQTRSFTLSPPHTSVFHLNLHIAISPSTARVSKNSDQQMCFAPTALFLPVVLSNLCGAMIMNLEAQQSNAKLLVRCLMSIAFAGPCKRASSVHLTSKENGHSWSRHYLRPQFDPKSITSFCNYGTLRKRTSLPTMRSSCVCAALAMRL